MINDRIRKLNNRIYFFLKFIFFLIWYPTVSPLLYRFYNAQFNIELMRSKQYFNTLVILTKVMNDTKMLTELETISKQNKVIISLLGRLAFSEDKILSILKKNSKKPEQMIKAYNMCNGEQTTNEIAKKLTGITNVSLNSATLRWEENGILINLGERGQGKNVIPLHLYKLGSDVNNE